MHIDSLQGGVGLHGGGHQGPFGSLCGVPHLAYLPIRFFYIYIFGRFPLPSIVKRKYRIYSNKRPYLNERAGPPPRPSLERNINWPKTSNIRPTPGPTWTILHHISGNTYFSIAKFDQCLFNQETDFLSVRKFSNYLVLRRDVHTPTSSPHPFECTAGHTSWDSENLNSVECAQNVKQGLTQAL